MKQILADYLEICLKFRKEYLSKPERKQRHILLTGWAKAQYAEANPTISELYEFWDKYKDNDSVKFEVVQPWLSR